MEKEIVNDNPVDTAVETPEVETPEVETPEVEAPAESEPAVEPLEPQTVPVGVVKRLRDEKRQLAAENLRLQSLTPPPAPAVVEEKSPVEKYIEEMGPDIPIDGKTYIAQQKWEKEQTTKKAQQTAVANQMNACQIAINDAILNMTDEEMGEGLAYTDLMAMGNNLLTMGDRVDILGAGNNAGNEAYKRLTQRILQKGGKTAEILRKRLDSRKEQLKQQKAKGSNIENPAPTPKPKVSKTQEEILTEFSDPHINAVFGIKPAEEE